MNDSDFTEESSQVCWKYKEGFQFCMIKFSCALNKNVPFID